jgi:hypothetical protein
LAKFLLERAAMENEGDAFLPSNITLPTYQAAMKKVKTARSREIFELFQKGRIEIYGLDQHCAFD